MKFAARIGFRCDGARPPHNADRRIHRRIQGSIRVEPICAQPNELGCGFAPSSYYEARFRKGSSRARRHAQLKVEILKEYDENYKCYGARKMWLELRGKGIDAARCTVERLMTTLGPQGARQEPVKRTTVPDPAATRAQDLVKRDFNSLAPNKLWVAEA